MLNDKLLCYVVEVALTHLLEPIPYLLLDQLLALIDYNLGRPIRLCCFFADSF